jgi:GNAT superfamily N-acetyltransferase
MSDVVVKRVSTRRERKQFLEFPWTLYRDDSNWIPPLRGHQKELVGYQWHPFYERNQTQTFLARHGAEVCGRIAAILNRGHIHRYSERRGFFGFFECVDDQQVANALFDAARKWFADQGIHSLRGPTNPSLNYELGLLIDGFDSPPFFMMTYNPEYYARLIEGYGFRKIQDLYAYWGHVEMLPQIRAKLEPIAEQIIERYEVRLRSLDRSRFVQDVEEFLSVYNRSMTETWGFVPMSRAEVRHVARALRHLIVPELTIAAEIDGRMVGASFGMLDYNPRIRQIDGRLFPFGIFRLLGNKRRLKRIRLVSTNVVPEFQRMGIGLVLMYGLVPKAMAWGLEEAEFSWVLESNFLSRGSLEKGGAKITKTYRLYDWEDETSGEKSSAGVRTAETGSPRAEAADAPLEIRQVRSREDLDRFCKVPWLIYAEDPQWVPPLLIDVKEFLNRGKHPFYLHGEAAQFLASRSGIPVGRILVSDDPRYNQQHGSNVGCFGMFESIQDHQVAHALLGAAADWLRCRGRSVMRGPIDYSISYPCGLLIEGFETPPRVLMNHHRPYYAGLLESWGLAKAKDLHSWWFLDPYDMVEKWRRRAERLVRRGEVTVRPFRTDDFEAEVCRCRDVYNEAWRESWGFVDLTDAELRYLARRLDRLAMADLVLLAEVDARPVGFSITLPDINEAIRPLNGRLTNFGLPINLLRLAYRSRHIKTARMAVLGLLPEYRRRGIAELLILRTLDYGKNTIGYTGAELGWTLEDNHLINRTLEAVGARRYKTYRIYEKQLDG